MTAEAYFLLALSAVLWATYAGTTLLVQLGWYRARERRHLPSPTEPASLLIAYHNEEAVLPALLRSMAGLRHRPLQIVLVNDRSTDLGPGLVADWIKANPQLDVVHVRIAHTPTGWSGKKWALHQGLQLCQHPYILQTDADCTLPPEWADTLVAALHNGAHIAIGYGHLTTGRGLLGRLQRYETLHTAWLMLGLAGAGRAWMATGRSMAYRRSVRPQVYWHLFAHTPSGDDDLLVQYYPQKRKIRPVISPGARTTSHAPGTWRAWWQQKRRHTGAARLYTARTQLWLGLYGLMPVGAVYSLWLLPWWHWTLTAGLWLLPLCIKLHSLRRAGRRLGVRLGPLHLVYLELFWYLYGWLISLATIRPTLKWQSRAEIRKKTRSS